MIIFTNFWAFVAAVILIGVTGEAIAKIVRAWKYNEAP